MNELLTSAEGQVLSKPGASYKYYIILSSQHLYKVGMYFSYLRDMAKSEAQRGKHLPNITELGMYKAVFYFDSRAFAVFLILCSVLTAWLRQCYFISIVIVYDKHFMEA